MRHRTVVSSVVLTLAIAGCDTDRVAAPGDKPAAIEAPAAPRAGFQVVKASGDVDVRAAVAQFQTLLGDPSNGITPGQQESAAEDQLGRGPPELTNTDALPADQFFRNGLIYTIVGSGLRITATTLPTSTRRTLISSRPSARRRPLRRSAARSPKSLSGWRGAALQPR